MATPHGDLLLVVIRDGEGVVGDVEEKVRGGEVRVEMEKAVTLVMLQKPAPAREPTTWTHAPSQPLMRPPLSRFLTPADFSQNRRFFRVRKLSESPRRAYHPAYFGLAT